MKKIVVIAISMVLAVTLFMAVPVHAVGALVMSSSTYWNLASLNDIWIRDNGGNNQVQLYDSLTVSDKQSVSLDDIVFDSSLITANFTTTQDWSSSFYSFTDYTLDSTTICTSFNIRFVRPLYVNPGQTLEFYFYLTDMDFAHEAYPGHLQRMMPLNYGTGSSMYTTALPAFLYDSEGVSYLGNSTRSYFYYNQSYYNICFRVSYSCTDTRKCFDYFAVTFNSTWNLSVSWLSGHYLRFRVVGSPLMVFDTDSGNPGFYEEPTPAESEIIAGQQEINQNLDSIESQQVITNDNLDTLESQQAATNDKLDEINDKLNELYVIETVVPDPAYDPGELVGESEAVESAEDLMEAVESAMNSQELVSGSQFWQDLISEIIAVPALAVMGMMSGGFLLIKAFIGR